jgi:hypothetical protein
MIIMGIEKTDSKSRYTIIKNAMDRVGKNLTKKYSERPEKNTKLIDWVKCDDDLRSGLQNKFATISKTGYFFKNLSDSDKQKLDDIEFWKWHNESWWFELIFKNSFTEVGVTEKSTPKKLYLFSPDNTQIVPDYNGDPIAYLQIPTNLDESIRSIPKDRVVHIYYDNLDNSNWGYSELLTLIPILINKKIIEGYISWLFDSNQFRSIITIPESVPSEEIEEYITIIEQTLKNKLSFLALHGENIKWGQLMTFSDFDVLLKLLDYYTSKAINLLQIPPIKAGQLESSNRSSSEYQIRYSYYDDMKSWMKQKEDFINKILLPKLNIKAEFKYNLIDNKEKQDLLDSAQKLKLLGANTKKLNKYIIDNGLNIPDDLLEEMDFIAGKQIPTNMSVSDKGTVLDKNSDLQPSRKKTEMDFAGGSRIK